MVEPLPFRLPVPDADTVDLEGIESVTYTFEGLLHRKEDNLVLEWSGPRTTGYLVFTGIGADAARSRAPITTGERYAASDGDPYP